MKLRSVQVLRAVAVVAVVLHHFASFEAGAAGVDLFFVISGFIMVKVMPGKTPWAFARARLWRILPTYWAATALLLALPATSIAARPLLDSLLLVPGGDLYLPQSWTLIWELTFYACCVAFMLWGARAFLVWPIALLLASSVPYAGIVASPLFLEFLLGCAVARSPLTKGWWALAVASVLLFAFAGMDRTLAYGVPSAFLLHAAVSLERHFRRWANVPVLIGDASYSIYLTHWSFLAVLPARHWVSGGWIADAYVAVLLGIAFYFAVEKPLGHLGRRRIGLVGRPPGSDPVRVSL